MDISYKLCQIYAREDKKIQKLIILRLNSVRVTIIFKAIIYVIIYTETLDELFMSKMVLNSLKL